MDFQNWAFGYGVQWVGASGRLTINTPQAVTAVSAFRRVYDSGIIPVGDDFSTQRIRFKQGHVAMGIDNSGGALNIASGGPLQSRDLCAAPMPFPHPGAHQQLFIALTTRSAHRAEAIAFLRWLVSPAAQQALRQVSGPDTLATDVPMSAAFQLENPWAATFAELAERSRSVLIPGYEVSTMLIMRIVMQAIEHVIIGGRPPEIALADAQRKIDAKFQ